MVEFIKNLWFWQFFGNNPLPPFFCSGKNIFRNAVWEECAIPVSLGDNNKNIGESFFLTHKRIGSNLNTINLKLLGNHGGIHRFRRKFKKDSGEIKHLGVHRNMVIGNWQYVCILFCWSWSSLRVEIIFRKERRAKSGGGGLFWNSEYRHLCTPP